MLTALKARSEVAALCCRETNRQFNLAPSALDGLAWYASWGVAPGYCISRLWRLQTNGTACFKSLSSFRNLRLLER
jgi:hypothetical protein